VEEAEAAFTKAHVPLTHLLQGRVFGSLPVQEAVRIERARGDLFERAGRPKESLAARKTALQGLRQVREELRARPAYWEQFSEVLEGASRVQPEAEARRVVLRELAATRERLVVLFPQEWERREALARTYLDLAHSARGVRDAEAVFAYQGALVHRERLQANRPTPAEEWALTAELRHELARLHLKRERPRLAKQEARKAIEDQETARKKAPDVAGHRKRLAAHHALLLEVCQRLNEHEEVASLTPKWLALAGESAEHCRRAAGLLAWCAARPEAKGKAEEYATQAVQLLDRAIRQGYKDIADLEKSAELAPLRTREDFRHLLGRLGPGR
jgi:hypothetical protein